MKLDPDYKAPLTDGILTIDIPGTDSWTDMLNNVRIGRRKVHGCRVNRLDRAEALAIIRALREKISQAREIYIYGHSRGGAIALQVVFELTANPSKIEWLSVEELFSDLNNKDYTDISVVVTAAKPTGDARFRFFVGGFVEGAYRHRGDIIPFLPPWQPNIKHSVFGNWKPLWEAHKVKYYRDIRESVKNGMV